MQPDRVIKIPRKGHRKPTSRSVVSLGLSYAAGTSYGPREEEEPRRTGSGKRWPSVFAHAMGHDVFRRKRRRGGRGESKARGERKEKKKSPLKESGGHMSPLLLVVLVSQDLMLKIDAEGGNKVDRGLNGGQLEDDHLHHPAPRINTMTPTFQSQTGVS